MKATAKKRIQSRRALYDLRMKREDLDSFSFLWLHWKKFIALPPRHALPPSTTGYLSSIIIFVVLIEQKFYYHSSSERHKILLMDRFLCVRFFFGNVIFYSNRNEEKNFKDIPLENCFYNEFVDSTMRGFIRLSCVFFPCGNVLNLCYANIGSHWLRISNKLEIRSLFFIHVIFLFFSFETLFFFFSIFFLFFMRCGLLRLMFLNWIFLAWFWFSGDI